MSGRPWALLATLASVAAASVASPHSIGVSGTHVMDWHGETVSRVVSASFSWNNLGATVLSFSPGTTVDVDGRSCMRAVGLNVDVRDSYAFDIAEPVLLTLVMDRQSSAPGVAVMYDRSGGPGRVTRDLDATGSDRFVELAIPLPDAQFANRGDQGTDLMLAAAASSASGNTQPLPEITVCDIRIARSFQTHTAEPGWLDLTLADEKGAPTAARMGLYDSRGRLPVPSPDAVEIRKFEDLTRTYLLQASAIWPHDDRFVFYVDGHYRAQVPAGRYRLIAAKGIEYRMLDQPVEIRSGQTTRRSLRMQRAVDMPGRGWYSGDVHIHNTRLDEQDSVRLGAQARGEDLHLANILQMGNVARTYFPQYAWGKAGRFQRGTYALVSGQEDPRTMVLGHTIHLDLEHSVRFPDDYLGYRRVFDAVAAQGGISGFAHVTGRKLEDSGPAGWASGGTEGMALQATSGRLDFAEVMQASAIGTSEWFALLDLGYRLAPAAGTDYPYIEHPGAVRSYVETGRSYAVDAWFEGLKQGRTFVTNGPMLEMSLNGRGIGSEVRVSRGEPIRVSARATLNPDIGKLIRLELVRHDDVIASEASEQGAGQLDLRFGEPAQRSAWYVVRAQGQRPGHSASITAISAPVYVVVDGEERVWKREAVRGITERLISALEAVKNRALEDVFDSEPWDTMPVWTDDLPRQLAQVREPIEAAQQKLRDLAEAAQRQP
jgi:hypothetical protein